MIEFEDGQRWLIYSTTSMRTDRIKGQQWDAFNIMSIDETIVKAILVYPDGLPEDQVACFMSQNEKYTGGIEVSSIEAILSQEELSNAIEAETLSNFSTGRAKDIQGREFEKRVATILSNPENLYKWKTGDPTAVGLHYSMFDAILSSFGIPKEAIDSVSAKTGQEAHLALPSGGNPKTDILVAIEICGDIEYRTISCKRTSSTSVAVHQYNADSFSRVLNPNDENLHSLLSLFQRCGSMERMGTEACLALESALQPYVRQLVLWAIGGVGGDGDSRIHWATHLLTYNNVNRTFSIHTIEDYCELLLSSGVRGSFGTPFGWTYPSKRRGRDIQLKCKIL